MLDIVPNCNPAQYKGKLMMQVWENEEKANFGLNFGAPKFSSRVLSLLVVRHCFKLLSYAM